MRCKKCEQPIADGAHVCEFCGEPVLNAEEQTAGATAPLPEDDRIIRLDADETQTQPGGQLRRKKRGLWMALAAGVLVASAAAVLLILRPWSRKEPERPAEAFAPEPTQAPFSVDEMRIAFILEITGEYNVEAWNGITAFAEQYGLEQGRGYDYYRLFGDGTDDRVDTIRQAIDEGANVVICSGYLFEEPVWLMQDEYPDVQFLLHDGEPHDANWEQYRTAPNTLCVLYREEQAGFLAGYAMVRDGCTKLGFVGAREIPYIERYGYGFLQGVDLAAREMGIADRVSVNYTYADSFAPSDALKNKMREWYHGGTEVVFAVGGGVYLSALSVAKYADRDAGYRVIGAEFDQSDEGDCIVTSAMKGVTSATAAALNDLAANGGRWSDAYAGKTVLLGAAENGVLLPIEGDAWRMSRFTEEDYREIYNRLANGDVTVSRETDHIPAVTVAVDWHA